MKKMVSNKEDLLEFDWKRDSVEKDINLEDAQEEKAKVFEHLSKKIPEEANIWGEVWYWQTGKRKKQWVPREYKCIIYRLHMERKIPRIIVK